MIIALSSEVAVMKQIADTIGRDKKVVFIDTASNRQMWDKSWLDNQIWAIKKEYSDFKIDLESFDIIHI
jgi:hypothetical protein